MKSIATFLFPIFFLGCATSPNPAARSDAQAYPTDSEIVESTILWRTEIDEVTWEPLKLTEMLSDTGSYTREGNFFVVNNGLRVFGHEAIFIGTLGIELLPGPNVFLKGRPGSIADYIASRYDISFERETNAYSSDLGSHIRLIVAPHPELEETTMVIGAYLGP